MNTRILIVEDDPDLAAALADVLAADHETVIAHDARTALALMKEHQPNLLLVDVILARGTGLQILEHLVAQPNPEVRALVITGYADDVDLSPFRQVIGGVLRKPCSLSEIVQKVTRILNGAPAPEEPVAPLPRKVLAVLGEPGCAAQLSAHMEGAGYQMVLPVHPSETLHLLADPAFDAVVIDWALPGHDGLDLVKESRRLLPGRPVVILVDVPTGAFVQKAMSQGADEIVPKRFLPEALSLALEITTQRRLLATRAVPASDRPAPPRRGSARRAEPLCTARYSLADIRGGSAAMEAARETLRRFARMDSTVLITGETGTGKELFAQALHSISPRHSGPFVATNAAAIPESLLEAELFGYAAGAFTGSKREGREGLLPQAHGGTLFLDEIGDLPLSLQSKLLRVLEEGIVTPVGGEARAVDVRFVAATNRDLRLLVQDGQFRSDLYHRLNVLVLKLPPLRQRKEDIPELALSLLEQLHERYGGPALAFARTTLEQLQSYDWPGNVRELKNAVEHGFAHASGNLIHPDDLPEQVIGAVWQAAASPPEEMTPTVLERREIIQALIETDGNKLKAAKLLGISRSNLYLKLKLYELD